MHESVILVLLVLLAAFLLYPRREGFYAPPPPPPPQEGVSTRTIFAQSEDNASQDKNMQRFSTSVIDGKDMMSMSRCYQFTTQEGMGILENALKSINMVYYRNDFMAASTSDINTRVLQYVLEFHNRINRVPIKGKVHVFISVAPFWRDDKNRMIVSQWNSTDYLSKADLGRGNPVYTSIIMVFPSYVFAIDKSVAVTSLDPPLSIGNVKIINNQPLSSYESRHKLCLLEVPTSDAYRTYGGCQTIQNPYESRCLGPSNPKSTTQVDKDRVTPSTFIVMYDINKRFSSFIVSDIFESL
jgi:hypothetical protein